MEQKQGLAETGYLNVLRVFACSTIVLGHVLARMVDSYRSFLTDTEIILCKLLEHIFIIWAIPVFVMITGILFLKKDKEISVKLLFQKYIRRIALALLIFGLPFAFLTVFFDANYQFSVGQIGTAFIHLLQGKSWDHIWYLYMILSLYMLVPVFKIFANYADKKTLEYVLIVLFIFTSVIPTIQDVFPFEFGFYIPITSFFAFYLLLGYYIHAYNFRISNKIIYLIGALYIICVIWLSVTKKFYDVDGSIYIMGLRRNMSPLIVIFSVCVFCYVRQNVSSNLSSKKIFVFIAPLTYGIYLIHPVFLNVIFKFLKFTPDNYPLAPVIILSTVVTTILSVLLTFAARKVKLIRKYVL